MGLRARQLAVGADAASCIAIGVDQDSDHGLRQRREIRDLSRIEAAAPQIQHHKPTLARVRKEFQSR